MNQGKPRMDFQSQKLEEVGKDSFLETLERAWPW